MGKQEANHYRIVASWELLNNCLLIDVESKSCAFTWVNNRDRNALVKKRLGKILCNIDLRMKFPNVKVYAMPTL